MINKKLFLIKKFLTLSDANAKIICDPSRGGIGIKLNNPQKKL